MTQGESVPGLLVIPGRPGVRRREAVAGFAVQLAHRAAIVGFFALLATFGLLYTAGNPHWAVTVVFACADVGCCAALFGRCLLMPGQRRRESTGVLLFNAVLLVLGLQLILLTRLDVIRSIATAFFRPD